MAQEYRYPLTRVCLRHGTLTLPRTMLGLFPDQGDATLVDAATDEEYVVEIDGPRRVVGLRPLFEAHGLDVNDELVLRPLEDGRFSVTAVRRGRPTARGGEAALDALLDELVEAQLPVTEAEIRALYPDLPDAVSLRGVLESDVRFAYHDGRWHPGGSEVDADIAPAEAAEVPPVTAGEAVGAAADVRQEAHQGGLWEAPAAPVPVPVPRAAPDVPGRPGGADVPPPTVHERRAAPLAGRDEPRAAADEDVDLEHVNRARTALRGFGFRVDPLGQGQLLAHAELGRRHFTVLVSALAPGRRLDWAALLARRRETGARYLAVFGDGRDLLRLTSPAELARATLWSWDGLARASNLSRTVPVSAFDLQAHFEQGGLFEHGLERFEKTVEGRIAERGAFSEVLTRLAALRAPTVFLLEELATGEGDVPRDQVLKVLERLSEAPFHLVARVGSGEFCLRHAVPEALDHLSEYARSLRGRLPSRTRQRLTGLDEPELLTAEELAGETAGEPAEAATGDAISSEGEGSSVAGPPREGASGALTAADARSGGGVVDAGSRDEDDASAPLAENDTPNRR